MDLIKYNEKKFQKILSDYQKFSHKLNFTNVVNIPISALKGDNVYKKSSQMKWYKGDTLFNHLETVDVSKALSKNFSMPVQWVNRPNSDFRGYTGTITSGTIKKNDEIIVLPSNTFAKVKDIIVYDKKLKSATSKQSITLTLNKEIDISRGDVLCHKKLPIETADQFNINIIWMSEEKCFSGRAYIAKIHTQSSSCKILDIKKIYDVNTLKENIAKDLGLNDVAEANIAFSKPIAFQPYKENRHLGSIIFIDPINNQTVGVGMINFALHRSQNIHLQSLAIDQELREKMNGHKGQVIWLTGLSGSGKSTIANALEIELYAQGKKTYVLDGDNIRHGLNKDLGFKDNDRVENIRRVAEVSKLMASAGLIVITAFISPFRSERAMAKNLFKENEFKEIYISTPLSIAEKRDPKGLYKKARAGKIPNFTGISSVYEEPINADLIIETEKISVKKAVKKILKLIN